MRCPWLSELPPPPAGKSGWPWTEETPPLPDRMPDGSDWPRISIITPNYNREAFLEEAIRSVLLQGYPDLEYIIVDGASTDGSVDIIRKYERWIASWTSEPDSGPGQAINRGLGRVSGGVFGLALSDDRLCLGSLNIVGDAHSGHPEAILAGDVLNFSPADGSETLIRQRGLELGNAVEFWKARMRFQTPGLFFPMRLVRSIGEFDEVTLTNDYDYLCRALVHADVYYLHRAVAAFRIHPGSKTSGDSADLIWLDLARISKRYWSRLPSVDVAGYRRFQSIQCVSIGLARLVRGQPHSIQFLVEGIKAHPGWCLHAGMKLLFQWAGRRLPFRRFQFNLP